MSKEKQRKGQKHHYIPQFYLRCWLGKDHKLEEFGRVPPSNQIRSRRRGTKSTGYEYDLYTIPGVTEKTKQKIESVFMSTVDTTAAAARDLLLQGIIPEGQERIAWARFILSMGMRAPEEIKNFKANFLTLWKSPSEKIQKEYDSLKKPGWPDTLEGYFLAEDPTTPERQALLIATKLIQNENVIRLLMGAKWSVLDTSFIKRPLMTSDHPLVMTNGLGRPDGHFAMPISPRHLFIAFMKTDFKAKFESMPVGKIVRLSNQAIIGQARKNVYGIDGANISEVRRLMGKREYPSLIPELTKERKV